MEKTSLDDDTKLDLTADHVHPLTISQGDALEIINASLGNLELDELINDALDYMEAEGRDAILVLTIKKE